MNPLCVMHTATPHNVIVRGCLDMASRKTTTRTSDLLAFLLLCE